MPRDDAAPDAPTPPESPAALPLESPAAPDPRIAYFAALADRWDAIGPDPAATVARLADLDHLLRLRPGEDLLEVGCGTGQITGWLADQVAPGRVVAVDFAEPMLEVARQKGIAAEFRRADVCCDDLGRGGFDVALCFHAFPHFRDPAAALHRLARALRSEGRLLVMHLIGSARLRAIHREAGGAVGGDCLPTRDQWATLLEQAGLDLRRFEDRDDLFFVEAGLRSPAA